MRARLSVRAGMAAAAVAVVLVCAGCVPHPKPAPPTPPAPASLTVGPSPVTFQTVAPPYSWMPQVPVTITNTGGRALNALVINGVGVYSVPTDGCKNSPTPDALAAGKSCVVFIQFCPSAAGPYNDSFVVTAQDATSGAPLQASTMLTGTAT